MLLQVGGLRTSYIFIEDSQYIMVLEETAALAGLFTAHAIRFLADGETLYPMLGVEMPDGSKTLRRLVEGKREVIVAESQQWLAVNPENAASGVLIYDGYINMEAGRTDAIHIEARCYGEEPVSFGIALPYQTPTAGQKLAFYRPKLIALQQIEQDDMQSLIDAFYRGVESDEKAAGIWSANLAEENDENSAA